MKQLKSQQNFTNNNCLLQLILLPRPWSKIKAKWAILCLDIYGYRISHIKPPLPIRILLTSRACPRFFAFVVCLWHPIGLPIPAIVAMESGRIVEWAKLEVVYLTKMQPFPLGQIFFSRHDSKTVQQVWSADVYHQQHEKIENGKMVKFIHTCTSIYILYISINMYNIYIHIYTL